MKTNENEMSDEDMPGLFCDADRASLKAQATYLQLVRFDLAIIAIAAALGSIFTPDALWQTILAVSSAVAFGIGLVLSATLGVRRFERIWYGGRAIAESVKTSAWRYVMRAEPYNVPDRDADQRFTEALKAIINERKHLAAAFVADSGSPSPDQITPRMREVRRGDMTTRLAIYLSARVKDQRDWYRKKSAASGKSEGNWFAVIVLAQLLGLGAAIALVRWPTSPINAVGFFSALAAGAAAWMQVRRYQELAQSYAVASHELGLIQATGASVTSDAELSLFVSDSENAISREHTLWTARRDV